MYVHLFTWISCEFSSRSWKTKIMVHEIRHLYSGWYSLTKEAMERLDLNISETGCSQLSVHDIRVQKDISQNINNPCMTVDHTMGCILTVPSRYNTGFRKRPSTFTDLQYRHKFCLHKEIVSHISHNCTEWRRLSFLWDEVTITSSLSYSENCWKHLILIGKMYSN